MVTREVPMTCVYFFFPRTSFCFCLLFSQRSIFLLKDRRDVVSERRRGKRSSVRDLCLSRQLLGYTHSGLQLWCQRLLWCLFLSPPLCHWDPLDISSSVRSGMPDSFYCNPLSSHRSSRGSGEGVAIGRLHGPRIGAPSFRDPVSPACDLHKCCSILFVLFSALGGTGRL